MSDTTQQQNKPINTSNIVDVTFLKSNVIDHNETTREIKDTLNAISSTLANSLGPYGSTTIIEDLNNDHFMSKDGYTILKNMQYYNNIPRTVLEIVKKISKTLVRTVGDGSTSSVIIASALFECINNIVNNTKMALAPHDVITILSVLSDILEDEIRTSSNKIDDEKFSESIYKIATISTNNDEECGKLFADIFNEIGRYGFINIENSPNEKDFYKKINGIEINRGWVNQRMANQDDKISVNYEKPLILMSNDTLGDDEMEFVASILETSCIRNNTPLVIIAPMYSSSFLTFFDANLQKNKHLPVLAIDIDYTTVHGKERFHDLELALGCTCYDKYSGDMTAKDLHISMLGSCDRIVGNDMHTMFIDGKGLTINKEKIDLLIENLHNRINEISKSDDTNKEKEVFNLKKRIATLTNSMITLYVGGNLN